MQYEQKKLPEIRWKATNGESLSMATLSCHYKKACRYEPTISIL